MLHSFAKNSNNIHPKSSLSNKAKLLTVGASPLYHGTRYGREILRKGYLAPAIYGDRAVCFTRSPQEAAYWALLERDDDEGLGSIFIFDRDLLKNKYRICIINDNDLRDEQEERVWNRDISLCDGLIGVIIQPDSKRYFNHGERLFRRNVRHYYNQREMLLQGQLE